MEGLVELASVVDLERYPIHALAGPEGTSLIRSCHDQMADAGACVLPGFIRPAALATVVEHIAPLETHRRSSRQSAWGDPPDPDMGPDHVHRRLWPQDIDVVAGDQLDDANPLALVHGHPAVLEFLAAALGLDRVYPFTDPYQRINIVSIVAGNEHAWHYDLSDFVVTVLLQAPEAGGEFEFAPFIRGDVIPGVVGGRDGRVWHERYGEVERLFAGEWPGVRTLDLEPGALVLFNGERSLHRVRRVEGSRPRMVAVLSYDHEPDQRSTDEINVALYGPRVARLVGLDPEAR